MERKLTIVIAALALVVSLGVAISLKSSISDLREANLALPVGGTSNYDIVEAGEVSSTGTSTNNNLQSVVKTASFASATGTLCVFENPFDASTTPYQATTTVDFAIVDVTSGIASSTSYTVGTSSIAGAAGLDRLPDPSALIYGAYVASNTKAYIINDSNAVGPGGGNFQLTTNGSTTAAVKPMMLVLPGELVRVYATGTNIQASGPTGNTFFASSTQAGVCTVRFLRR